MSDDPVILSKAKDPCILPGAELHRFFASLRMTSDNRKSKNVEIR